MCILRNSASEKWMNAIRIAEVVLCSGLFLSACAGGLAVNGESAPLIPALNQDAARGPEKQRNGDSDPALVGAPAEKKGAIHEQDRVVLGSGLFWT